MQAEAKIQLGDAYFQEASQEFVHVGLWRWFYRWPFLGMMLTFGTPFGAYNAKQILSVGAGGELELEFSDEGVVSRGLFRDGMTSWDSVEKVAATPCGAFFWYNTGAFFYLPKRLVVPGFAFERIIHLAKRHL